MQPELAEFVWCVWRQKGQDHNENSSELICIHSLALTQKPTAHPTAFTAWFTYFHPFLQIDKETKKKKSGFLSSILCPIFPARL